jgi:hypothetical protein
MSVQITTSAPKEEESGLISLETLESLQKEIILKLVDLWRSYAEDRRGKSKKFHLGLDLLDRIVQAMRVNPDLVELDEIEKVYAEIQVHWKNHPEWGRFPKPIPQVSSEVPIL